LASCGCDQAGDAAQDAGGVVATLEVDGKPRHLSLLRSRLGLDGAPDSGCVIVLRDLTEQVEAMRAQRDSEQRLRIIFEQSPVGVCLLDGDLTVREANEHFAAMTGRPSAELVGGPLSRGDLANIANACEVALAGAPASFCGPLAGRDGVERFVECEVEPLRDPEGLVTGAILLTVPGAKSSWRSTTWTGSPPPRRRSGTRGPTSCCRLSASGCGPTSARPTPWRAGAATSSPWSCRACAQRASLGSVSAWWAALPSRSTWTTRRCG
jgi:PAS domain S-box-containing protein